MFRKLLIGLSVVSRIFIWNEWWRAAMRLSCNPGNKLIKTQHGCAVSFNEGNLIIDRRYPVHFLWASEYLIPLQKSYGLEISTKNNEYHIQIDGVRFKITGHFDIYVIYEVYELLMYNFTIPSKKKNIIIDIGMNVGTASLYFASLEQNHHIYSYEPILDIHNRALENFDLNPQLKNKIKPYSWGLGKKDGSMNFQFHAEHHGNTAREGFHMEKGVENIISSKIKNAETIIHEISERHSEMNIIVKIDCEGMEFDIFESFISPLPKNIKLFMMEWHFKNPSPIISTLEKNGFSTIRSGTEIGMLYALK